MSECSFSQPYSYHTTRLLFNGVVRLAIPWLPLQLKITGNKIQFNYLYSWQLTVTQLSKGMHMLDTYLMIKRFRGVDFGNESPQVLPPVFSNAKQSAVGTIFLETTPSWLPGCLYPTSHFLAFKVSQNKIPNLLYIYWKYLRFI